MATGMVMLDNINISIERLSMSRHLLPSHILLSHSVPDEALAINNGLICLGVVA